MSVKIAVLVALRQAYSNAEEIYDQIIKVALETYDLTEKNAWDVYLEAPHSTIRDSAWRVYEQTRDKAEEKKEQSIAAARAQYYRDRSAALDVALSAKS